MCGFLRQGFPGCPGTHFTDQVDFEFTEIYLNLSPITGTEAMYHHTWLFFFGGHGSLIPSLKGQREAYLYEFEANLIYTVIFRPIIHNIQSS